MSATTSDDHGRFQLRKVNLDVPFVFADGPGLRFRGCFLPTVEGPISMTMTRLDEPPEATVRLDEYRFSDERRKALLQRLLLPVLERARKLKDAAARTMVLWNWPTSIRSLSSMN